MFCQAEAYTAFLHGSKIYSDLKHVFGDSTGYIPDISSLCGPNFCPALWKTKTTCVLLTISSSEIAYKDKAEITDTLIQVLISYSLPMKPANTTSRIARRSRMRINTITPTVTGEATRTATNITIPTINAIPSLPLTSLVPILNTYFITELPLLLQNLCK